MRLLATLAAVASVNAFMDDDFLLRSRRSDNDDEGCDEGEVEVGGICTDPETAALLQDMLEDDDEDESSSNADGRFRKFPMGSESSSSDGSSGFADSGLERTKRRSQRITLLMAKATAAGTLINPDTGKKFKSRDFIQRVNNYGCHCWARTTKEHLAGYGKPLDEVDSTCWALKQCHKCLSIDYPERCDPVDTKYKAKLSKTSNGLEISCNNTLNKKGTNNGDCKKSLCECDKAFADTFAGVFNSWDASNWKLDEGGNYDQYCERQSSATRSMGDQRDSCCGNYPIRKAYNSQSHQCVDGEVTNDNM